MSDRSDTLTRGPSLGGIRGVRETLVLLLLAAVSAFAQPLPGIPEPGLVLYGQVRNVAGGQNTRLIVGRLQWTIQPAIGTPIVWETALTNLHDQFSYLVPVPFETVLPGFTLSPDSLELTPALATYHRTATVDGAAASIVAPASANFTFSSAIRGRMERVDLEVSLTPADEDNDGMPDAWERQFALDPKNPNDAGEDRDHDGLTNLAEYQAGTDPTDARSLFRFITVASESPTVVRVEWSSAVGRSYTVERSTDLRSGFRPLVTGLPATAPVNTFRDVAATGAGPYFYRIRIE